LIFLVSGYDPGFVVALILLTSAAIGGFATLGVALYFVYHVNVQARLSWDHKIIWSTVLLVFWILAAPVYWYYFVWKEVETQQASQAFGGESELDERQSTHAALEILGREANMLRKILLGLVSCSGIVGGIATFFILIFRPIEFFSLALCIELVAGLALTATMLYYIYRVYHDERFKAEEKVIWVLVLLILAPITVPAYWYRYIWRATKEDESGRQPA